MFLSDLDPEEQHTYLHTLVRIKSSEEASKKKDIETVETLSRQVEILKTSLTRLENTFERLASSGSLKA